MTLFFGGLACYLVGFFFALWWSGSRPYYHGTMECQDCGAVFLPFKCPSCGSWDTDAAPHGTDARQ